MSTYRIVTVLLIIIVVTQIAGLVKFKSLNCEALDKSYGHFEYCKIKAVSRVANSISLSYMLEQRVNDSKVHFKVMRRANGWRPFFANNHVLDACEFLRLPKSNFIANLFYKHGKNYTNVNHTCPFMKGEAMRIQDLRSDIQSTINKLPLDIGEYGLFTEFYAHGVLAAKIVGSIAYMDYRSPNQG